MHTERTFRGRGYPRPLLRRAYWQSLNNYWDYTRDFEQSFETPEDVRWSGETIVVPYAVETAASGIHDTRFQKAVWYRRNLNVAPAPDGQHTLLHFGAVDWSAKVWVDNRLVGTHEGGYTPFTIDLTSAGIEEGTHELVVRAEDDSRDLGKPRGKQDWELEPHGIWYQRCTGIWQTVWTEQVPAAWIGRFDTACEFEFFSLNIHAEIEGAFAEDMQLQLRFSVNGKSLGETSVEIYGPDVRHTVPLEYRGDPSRFYWSPDNPVLIDIEARLVDADGKSIDEVASYTAMRSIRVKNDQIELNGQPVQLIAVLDQGLWPDTGYIAGNDEQYRRDVLLTKGLGFNTVRKHQKAEDPRYLYWADHEGLMVFSELPPAFQFSRKSTQRSEMQWREILLRDSSHPSIIGWVVFNETSGVHEKNRDHLPPGPRERAFMTRMLQLTQELGGSRLIIGNDGWEALGGDIIGIHDYHPDQGVIEARYGRPINRDTLNTPAGARRGEHRQICLDDPDLPAAGDPLGQEKRVIAVTECGGIALSSEAFALKHPSQVDSADTQEDWAYSVVADWDHFTQHYTMLIGTMRKGVPLICWTQLYDTAQEHNGILKANREPKGDLRLIQEANGLQPAHVVQAQQWLDHSLALGDNF